MAACLCLEGWKLQLDNIKRFEEFLLAAVAEYGIANKIVSEAAFSWWVPHELKKRLRIIIPVCYT